MTEREINNQQIAQLEADRTAFNQAVKVSIEKREKADFAPYAELEQRGEALTKERTRLDYEARLYEATKKRYLRDDLVDEVGFEKLWQGSLKAEAIKEEAATASQRAAHPLYQSF